VFGLGVLAVSADWVEEEKTGAWELATDTHWKTYDGAEEATLKYSYDAANFSRWSLLVDADLCTSAGTWGFAGTVEEVDLIVGDYPNGTYVRVHIEWESKILLLGAQQQFTVVKFYEPDGTEREIYYNAFSRRPVKAYFWRSSDTHLDVAIVILPTRNDLKALDSETFSFNVGSSFFSNVTLKQHIKKFTWGGWPSGWAEGWKFDEMILTNQGAVTVTIEGEMSLAEAIGYSIWRTLANIWESLKVLMPQPIQDFMNGIEDFSNFALTILGALFKVLAGIAPTLVGSGALLYGLYLLSLTLQCLYEQTFTPLWDHFMYMYNFMMNLAGRVIQIGQAIWSMLKFW
jgi:hypothetical protein